VPSKGLELKKKATPGWDETATGVAEAPAAGRAEAPPAGRDKKSAEGPQEAPAHAFFWPADPSP
jgi:hypothetical protein